MRITYLSGIFFLLMSSVISSGHKDPKELDAAKPKDDDINGLTALSKDNVVDDFKLIEEELKRNAESRERGISEQEKAENELNQLREAEKKADAARLANDENNAKIKRQNEISEREGHRSELEKEDKEARRKANRIKGITKDELNWSGLE